MTEEPIKKKYIIDQESDDEQIENEEQFALPEETEELSPQEKIKLKKEYEKTLKEQEKAAKQEEKKMLEAEVLKILSKGQVTSKQELTYLIAKSGIDNYSYRFSTTQNELRPHYEMLGGILKTLRILGKINFSLENGNHAFYIEKKKKIKVDTPKLKFDWSKHHIPSGVNEIYVIFKIPCFDVNPQHFLASCFPKADFDGFHVYVDKKYEKTRQFSIFKEKLSGYFDGDKLILKCKTDDKDTDKTFYTIVQIGRKILSELLKLSFRYSEILKISNFYNLAFFPVVPVYRAVERNAFYTTKFNNVFRFTYDFPELFEKKNVFGKTSILNKESDDEKFNLEEFYDFIEKSFNFQTKSFISNAIMKDWIINPRKAYNYMQTDDDLEKLIKEYIQDIDTERIVKRRLDETMEKNEFIKETTSNLLLTLLSLSFLADSIPLQWTVVIALVIINLYYFWTKSKKSRQREF